MTDLALKGCDPGLVRYGLAITGESAITLTAKLLPPPVDQRGMDLVFTGQLTYGFARVGFLENLELELAGVN